MFRILTLLATVAVAGTLSGGANAHPPDLHGGGYHASHSYGQPTTYAPTYVQPSYSRPTYSQPSYATPRYSAPAYDAAPIYSKTYRAPLRRTYTASTSYSQPTYQAPRRVSSYAGYTTPGYGYRHRSARSYAQPRYPLVEPRRYSYGSNRYSPAPMTESVSYGYSGGPTYGNDRFAVINGVRVFRPNND